MVEFWGFRESAKNEPSTAYTYTIPILSDEIKRKIL